MCRRILKCRLCALMLLFCLTVNISACAMTICWVTDGRYEFSKAVPQMYFYDTETQKLDVREIPFENVRLIQGEYLGMPIIAAYVPNAGIDLYACPWEVPSAGLSPFIHFSEIDLPVSELLAYGHDLMYVVQDNDPGDFFPYYGYCGD